jgi:hypothetical protein
VQAERGLHTVLQGLNLRKSASQMKVCQKMGCHS